MLILFSKKLSIEDAARLILNGHERTLVIHDEDSKLVGVVSQGDILRAIWNGISTKSSIEEFINYNEGANVPIFGSFGFGFLKFGLICCASKKPNCPSSLTVLTTLSLLYN